MNDLAFQSLDGTLEQVWQHLGRGIADRRSAARHPVMSTVCPDGHPDARVVVLRGVSRPRAELEVHTDLRSAKVEHLRRVPESLFCFWIPKSDLQIRIKTISVILSGDEVLPLWHGIPDPARRVYGGSPPPGSLLASSAEHLARPDPAALAVLRCKIQKIETLHLHADAHRRAVFHRDRDWNGDWIAP